VSIKYNQDCHDIGAQTITDPPVLHSEDWPPGIDVKPPTLASVSVLLSNPCTVW